MSGECTLDGPVGKLEPFLFEKKVQDQSHVTDLGSEGVVLPQLVAQ